MKKVFAIFLTVVVICLCFAGCGDNNSEETTGPSNIAIGIQSAWNCASVDIDAALEAKLEDALLENGSQVQIYEIDGDPYRISQDEIKSEYKTGLSTTNRQTQCDSLIAQISKIISTAVPVTSEVDIVRGITVLANAVNSMSYGNDNMNQIFIVSNLLSTKGVIDLKETTLYIDWNDFAEYIKEEIPDLSDIAVTWFVVDTADDQQTIPNSVRENLKDFYKTLIEGAGGTIEFIEQTSSNVDVDKSSWPAVSTVEIRNSTYSGGTVDVTLDESVLFQADSTEWIDEQAAEDTLSSLVDAINNSDDKIVVAGSTATTSSSEERHIEFSLKRASKVKELLIKLGADEDKLLAIGIGKSYDEYRVPDTGEFATEENREKNRCVFIVSATTDKGQYFLDVAKKFPINEL